MKIRVEHSLCDGNGLCAQEAPDLLELDENELAQVKGDAVTAEQIDAARRAMRICPKAAITLIE